MPSQRQTPDGLADKLAHELHVHQVELESQNEELRRTQSDLAAARDATGGEQRFQCVQIESVARMGG